MMPVRLAYDQLDVSMLSARAEDPANCCVE